MYKNIYALYKGEEILAIGTKKEIAKKLGIKVQTVSFYNTPSYRKRTSDIDSRRLVYIEKENDKCK